MDSGEDTELGTETYKKAAQYWSGVPATEDGMLGGFGFISHTDIIGSRNFLSQLFKMKNPPGEGRAVDCGAGIGRISKNLLLKLYSEVDLVEQNDVFLQEAKTYIGPTKIPVNFFNVGLQNFLPEVGCYDLIWCQWVLGHLTDEDLVAFFKSCIQGLKPNGVLVVKENLSSSGKLEIDSEDSSVTRTLPMLKELFRSAGLHCIKEMVQRNFPRGLYQVRMFALRQAKVTK